MKYIKILPILVLFCSVESGYRQETTLTVHIRSVYECKISIIPLYGLKVLKPIVVVDRVKNGHTTTFNLSNDELPGEFVIRLDYKENENSTPYPCEKKIIIGHQNLQLWVNPVFCNNNDSTWFQKGEVENKTYSRFQSENRNKREMLNLLHNFLLNYDKPESGFFRSASDEYEKRRLEYNNWITQQIRQYKSLFVSNMIYFQLIPKVDWSGNDSKRKESLRLNYFDQVDFSNQLILKTSSMKEWMDGYVNLYGENASTIPLRDSLFTLAGKTAIEKAKTGNPLVYGWMVDYFFNGYESFNIKRGIVMLRPYLEDPNCHTSKRLEITKRLEGIKTLVVGSEAPNFNINESDRGKFELYRFSSVKKYELLLFWSADCSHCQEMVANLYPWYQQEKIRKSLDLVAVSLDETVTEVKVWQQKKKELTSWINLRASDGMNSKVAKDYYLLGLPVMYLIDARTKKIIGSPENVEQLDKLLDL